MEKQKISPGWFKIASLYTPLASFLLKTKSAKIIANPDVFRLDLFLRNPYL